MHAARAEAALLTQDGAQVHWLLHFLVVLGHLDRLQQTKAGLAGRRCNEGGLAAGSRGSTGQQGMAATLYSSTKAAQVSCRLH